MQSVPGLAVLLSAVTLCSLTGVVVPADDGWPPPAAASVGVLLDDAAGLTGEGHSPAVDVDDNQPGREQTSLSPRRHRRRQKHHHSQQHRSEVRLMPMHHSRKHTFIYGTRFLLPFFPSFFLSPFPFFPLTPSAKWPLKSS